MNAHAYVNAAFLMPVNRSDASLTVTEQPTLVFGGISGRMVSRSYRLVHVSGTRLACLKLASWSVDIAMMLDWLLSCTVLLADDTIKTLGVLSLLL